MNTILSALYDFYVAHDGDIMSKIIASAGYDALKKALDFKALKQRLGGFFKKDQDSETFIQQLCQAPVDENVTVSDKLKTEYEKITGEAFEAEILDQLKEWITENKENIQTLNNVSISNSSGFNIGVQNAKGNIVNVQGDYKVNPKMDEH